MYITPMLTACLASSQHNPYDIYLLLCIQCKTPDDGQKTFPKHVEFYSKNKFEKSVLLGFIIRIYDGARSAECQTCDVCYIIAFMILWDTTSVPVCLQ